MPYKCVHCSRVYGDGAREVLSGCSSCSSRFFFYISENKLREIEKNKEEEAELDATEKKQMERDVRELTGIKDEETPVFLDFESVKVIKPGKYLLDIQKLFDKNKPRVYKLADGKYIIDLNLAVPEKNRI